VVTDVVPLLVLVTRILDDLDVRYVVGGSLASGVYGELRATNDVDLMIELPLERVGVFVEAMKPEFDIWEDTVRAAVAEGRSFGTLHIVWHVKIDFFPACGSPLDVRSLERRRPFRLPSEPTRDIFFTAPEDIVLRKLDWFRRSGGALERQLRDVVGVLKLQRDALDLAYLRETATTLELTELLDRCLADAGMAD
jgi:hypothetical protein